jgi:hypothetical protein
LIPGRISLFSQEIDRPLGMLFRLPKLNYPTRI